MKILVVAIALVAVGCSGGRGSSAVLHLSSGDTTEQQFREDFRGKLLGLGGVTFCSTVKGLSGAEIFRAVMNAQANQIIDTIRPDLGRDVHAETDSELATSIARLSTAKAELNAVTTVQPSTDGNRAGAIIGEECKRITG